MNLRSSTAIVVLLGALGLTAGSGVARAEGAPPPAAEGQAQASESLETALVAIQKMGARVAELRKGVNLASGERRDLLLPELSEVRTQYRRELNQAAARLSGSDPLPATPEQRRAGAARLIAALTAEGDQIQAEVELELDRLRSSSGGVERAGLEQRPSPEQARNASAAQVPLLLADLDQNLAARHLLGQDVAAQREKLGATLLNSSNLVGRTLRGIAATLDQIDQAAGKELKPEDQARRAAILEFRSLLVALQRKNLQLMDEYGLETAKQRQELISTTGQVSPDILNADVTRGLARKWQADALGWLSARAPGLVFSAFSFVLIVLLSLGLARLGRWLAQRAFGRSVHLSGLARDFFVTLSGRLILGVGLVVAAAQVGIEVGPLLAGLGIAGFVLGFALQDTLSNFASGMMILMYRPFDVNDVVEAGGVLGTVQAMNLVSTSILTPDNQMLIVPNNKIWGGVIRNVTHQPIRRVDLSFGLSHDDEGGHAQAVLDDILSQNPKVLKEPAPVVRLHELTNTSVNFVVRPWVKTEDYWDVYWDITREVKRCFDRDGLSVPFPRRNVRLVGPGAERQGGRISDVVPASGETMKARAEPAAR